MLTRHNLAQSGGEQLAAIHTHKDILLLLLFYYFYIIYP